MLWKLSAELVLERCDIRGRRYAPPISGSEEV